MTWKRRSAAVIVLLAALAGCGEDDESATPPAPTAQQPAAPQDRLIVGMGDQGSEMFADPRFQALKLKHARLVVPYDVIDVPANRADADAWLAGARKSGIEPFVTFGHSFEEPQKLPSVEEFRAAFEDFRRRYPQVKVYAAWNEINHSSQPTDDQPRRAAEYYNVVRAGCEGCTVLAGDLLDEPEMRDYLGEYQRHLDGTPAVWGLHNYADANRFRTRGLRELLNTVSGKVWLTETGGIVKFGKGFPRDEDRAAKATQYILDLAGKTPRVDRVYLYNWTAAAPDGRFDAGLVVPAGETRAAYFVLSEWLKARR